MQKNKEWFQLILFAWIILISNAIHKESISHAIYSVGFVMIACFVYLIRAIDSKCNELGQPNRT